MVPRISVARTRSPLVDGLDHLVASGILQPGPEANEGRPRLLCLHPDQLLHCGGRGDGGALQQQLARQRGAIQFAKADLDVNFGHQGPWGPQSCDCAALLP